MMEPWLGSEAMVVADKDEAMSLTSKVFWSGTSPSSRASRWRFSSASLSDPHGGSERTLLL